MTGACLTVSQVQSIPWSAAPSSTLLLLMTSAFVTPIVTRGVAAKPCAIRAAAVLEAPVSFQKKETGTGWRRMRIALGQNHRESGVTLKARVTWGAVNDSLCTVFSTLAIREGQATHPQYFCS